MQLLRPRRRTSPARGREVQDDASVRPGLERLPDGHKKLFRARLSHFDRACDTYAADRAAPWPASLRVKQLVGTRSVWEMSWSFSGPDGRCTFEFVLDDGELHCQWRRIGDHSIFTGP